MPTDVDLSEFHALNGASGYAGQCSVRTFVATLTEQEQADVTAAFAASGIQSSAIHKWLAKRGYQRRPETVRVHRKGECACGRS